MAYKCRCAAVRPCLHRWCTHHPKSVHSADSSVYVRSCGSAVSKERITTPRWAGVDLHLCCQYCFGRRPMAGKGESVRPPGCSSALFCTWSHSPIARLGRANDTSGGATRKQNQCFRGFQIRHGIFDSTGSSHRISMGTLRGTDPRADSHRRSRTRYNGSHYSALAFVCLRRSHIASCCFAGRQQGFRGYEAISWRGTLDQAGPRCRCVGSCPERRIGMGSRFPHSSLTRR